MEPNEKIKEVLDSLKRSLGIEIYDTHTVTIEKMKVKMRPLSYADQISATNLAYSFISPVAPPVAELIIKTMFISFSIVSMNDVPKPLIMGLEMSEVDDIAWKSSESYSDFLNSQSSALMSNWLLKGYDTSFIKKLAIEYETAFGVVDMEEVEKYLDYVKDQDEKESEMVEPKKS